MKNNYICPHCKANYEKEDWGFTHNTEVCKKLTSPEHLVSWGNIRYTMSYLKTLIILKMERIMDIRGGKGDVGV